MERGAFKMWGLMLKDLLNLKKQGQLFLVLLLVYGVLAFSSNMPELFSVFIMIGAVIPVTAEAFDERAHWGQGCPLLGWGFILGWAPSILRRHLASLSSRL